MEKNIGTTGEVGNVRAGRVGRTMQGVCRSWEQTKRNRPGEKGRERVRH